MYAFSIAAEAVPAAHTPQNVEQAAEKDLTLHLLGKAVTSGNWTIYLAPCLKTWQKSFGS